MVLVNLAGAAAEVLVLVAAHGGIEVSTTPRALVAELAPCSSTTRYNPTDVCRQYP